MKGEREQYVRSQILPYLTLKWAAIMLACALVILFFFVPAFTRPAFSTRHATLTDGRKVIHSLMQYTQDHGGSYPEGISSNQVFRQLIAAGYSTEKELSGWRSPYVADSKIGRAPDFSKALEPGECHWAFMRGMKLHDPGHLALLFENPVDGSWPPVWNEDAPIKPIPGRTLPGGGVVIGRNDGSIAIEPLASKEGDRIPAEDPTLFSHSPDRLLDPPYALPEPRPSP